MSKSNNCSKGMSSVWSNKADHLDLLAEEDISPQTHNDGDLYRKAIPMNVSTKTANESIQKILQKTKIEQITCGLGEQEDNPTSHSALIRNAPRTNLTYHNVPQRLTFASNFKQSHDDPAGIRTHYESISSKFNPLNHTQIEKKVEATEEERVTVNSGARSEHPDIVVQVGDTGTPETLRSNQDYGYYSKDLVNGLMKYDKELLSQWPNLPEDPKTKAKNKEDNHWNQMKYPEHDQNNPTRRVKPSSHMTRFQSEMNKTFSDFNPCVSRNRAMPRK